jgi:D-alanyl-D-alanine endopeptidase (penicillin-binding protein 7)
MRSKGMAVLCGAAALFLGTGFGANAAESKPARDPGLRSAAALVVDGGSGEVIYERKATLVAPIASITKLMTALVVLDAQQPLDEIITITKADHWKGKGAHSRLAVGTRLTRGDLLKLALMASENRAARVLARNYPGGSVAFIKTMNVKAKALGMTHTRFDDPSGLSSGNVSSPRDLAKLVSAAARDATIKEYSTLATHDVRVGRQMLRYGNTNLLVGKPDWQILVQKTGFTNDAGECLVMQALIDERPVTMVFLNSFGKLTRTADARRVRKWMAAQGESTLAGATGLAKK